MKKIEIEIPEGKKAEWVDGVLTLVDEKPQDITERIKTFDDACNALGDEHPFFKSYEKYMNTISEDGENDVIAYLKLRIICAALNDCWEPTFGADECRYYPWFYLYSKYDYEKLNEDENNSCVGRYSKSNTNGNLLYASASGSSAVSNSIRSSHLALKTRELAEYCGRQFINIWCDYLFG